MGVVTVAAAAVVAVVVVSAVVVETSPVVVWAEVDSLVVVATAGVSVVTTPDDETGTEDPVWGVGVIDSVSVVTGGGGGSVGVVVSDSGAVVWSGSIPGGAGSSVPVPFLPGSSATASIYTRSKILYLKWVWQYARAIVHSH